MQVSMPRRWPPDSPAWTACWSIAAVACAARPDRMLTRFHLEAGEPLPLRKQLGDVRFVVDHQDPAGPGGRGRWPDRSTGVRASSIHPASRHPWPARFPAGLLPISCRSDRGS
jgi:hypothetical protein